MAAVLHHEDLLLDDAEVVALLQLDHLDGGEVARGEALRLNQTMMSIMMRPELFVVVVVLLLESKIQISLSLLDYKI